MHSKGYSTWSVCLCVCVSVTQHLTLNVIIHATNDSNLPSGGWRSKILSDFLWKCFVAKLERFLLVRLRDKSATFFSTENTHMNESIATSQSHSNSAVVEVCKDIPYLTSLSKLNSDDVDDDFTVEVKLALKKLKTRKAGGLDGLPSEHLKYGGALLNFSMPSSALNTFHPTFWLELSGLYTKEKGKTHLSVTASEALLEHLLSSDLLIICSLKEYGLVSKLMVTPC